MNGAGKLQDVTRTIAKPIRRVLWDITVEGLDRLPAAGPAVLAPNHISFLDSAFLMMVLPRRISFVGKAEYMDSWKTKFLFPALGMIPIDRAGGSKSEGALMAAQSVLERGELFGIFPEGTRSRDGHLYRGHTGAARLALRVGCPLFPVGIVGTSDIQPPDAKLPKVFTSCTFTVGRPIKTDRYASRSDDHRLLRQLTDEMMFEIREMTGQVYKDQYATKKKDEGAAEAATIASAPASASSAASASPASATA